MNIKNISAIALTVLLWSACTKNTEADKTVKDVEVADSTVAATEKMKAEAEKGKLPKPYRPEEDAEARIAELIAQAQKEDKNIIMQAGGNNAGTQVSC